MVMMSDDKTRRSGSSLTFALSVEDGSDAAQARKLFMINFNQTLYLDYVKEEGEHSFIQITDNILLFRTYQF